VSIVSEVGSVLVTINDAGDGDLCIQVFVDSIDPTVSGELLTMLAAGALVEACERVQADSAAPGNRASRRSARRRR
jgi:hypothetical protein